MSFYDSFLLLCNKAGESPSAVAEEIGTSRSSVTRWKNGSRPTDATIRKIATRFNVPPDYFNDDRNKKAPTEDGEREDVITQHMQSSTKLAILIEMFNQLPEADQNDIIYQLLVKVRDQAAPDSQK